MQRVDIINVIETAKYESEELKMLTKGDKIVLVREIGAFVNVGEIGEITEVANSGIIWFELGKGAHIGCMSANEFEKYFKKYEEPNINISVDIDWVNEIINESHINIITVFDKCTIVACKLPNGFVIVESSSCVDLNDYNANIGIENCIDRIESKIRELEAYKRSDETYEDEDCVNSYLDCNNCEDDSCHYCTNKND